MFDIIDLRTDETVGSYPSYAAAQLAFDGMGNQLYLVIVAAENTHIIIIA